MFNVDNKLRKMSGYYTHKEINREFARDGNFTFGYVMLKEKGNYIVCEYSSDENILYSDRKIDRVLSFPAYIPIPDDFFDRLKELSFMREEFGEEGWKIAPEYSSLKDFEFKNPSTAYSFRTDKTERVLNRTIEVEKDKNTVKCRCGVCGYPGFVISNFTVYNGAKDGVVMDNVEIKKMRCIYCRTIVDGVVPIKY